jgi:hypothetical protein
MNQTRVPGTVSVVVGLVAVVILAFLAWQGVERWLARRALAAHLEHGKAYAARRFEELGLLPDELGESSGLATSRIQPGVLWSHNDSGDGPNLYAIDLSGRLLAIVPVSGATALDWEDIASGPCPTGMPASSCLYVADTGDNTRVRSELTVYIVVEPLLDGTGAGPPTLEARSFRYRYPDEPHDTEALVVLPDGDVTVVSKGRTGTIDFFVFPAAGIADALASGAVLVARHRGNTGIAPDARIGRLVTGAAVTPDGRMLAVRTYTEVFFFEAAGINSADGRSWRDLGRPCFLGDTEPQGEAIEHLDADTWLLTSERAMGRPGAIYRVQC